METIEFDIRGQVCPSTLLTALREINRYRNALREGKCRVAFLTDNRDATITIPETAGSMGYHVRVTKEAGHYLVTVGRTE
ncbi:sulfurtransferase TusA family protein [Geobacter pickeringii]|uniref:tRNA methyltransferase n=1 Tax=Geobacter pickeringii TaxID=345632 RepID=A0A0B5BFH0_9BACT|nr:sulfurtransferase TusA family protein [Geobacter pickeringii]AJE02816.1 tRNA methyltransferase [Geobacter pickeringii]